MTLRDYFAGQAITGLLLSRGSDFEACVKDAYKLADTLLAYRNETSTGDEPPITVQVDTDENRCVAVSVSGWVDTYEGE